MSNILEKIAERTRARVAEAKSREPMAVLAKHAENARQPHHFSDVFVAKQMNIIAEVKLASPSEGDILPGANPVTVADDYLSNGAAAVSVLTEPEFFKGHAGYLAAIRAKHSDARLLMKDFFLDSYQLLQARVVGADAVLILLAMLDKKQAQALITGAQKLSLTPLVEVHTPDEMKLAIDLGAKLIGVNNRDLKTMTVSLKTSEQLAKLARKHHILISESGIKTPADLKTLTGFGFRGFLVGTHLMKSGKPGAALATLLRGKK